MRLKVPPDDQVLSKESVTSRPASQGQSEMHLPYGRNTKGEGEPPRKETERPSVPGSLMNP